MQIKSAENNYIKFLLGKVQAGLIDSSPDSGNTVVINGLIDRLRSSDDLSKEIFILSKVNGLRKTSEYLAFVIKKVRERKIKYENFLINLDEDSSQVINLLKNLPEDFINDTSLILSTNKSEKDISNFSGSKFKVEEIVNELVDEEFQELAKIDELSENMASNYKEISNDRAEIPEDYFIENEIEKKENSNKKPVKTLPSTKRKQPLTENRNIVLNKKLIEFENKLYTINQSLRKDLGLLIDKCLLESSTDSESTKIRERIVSSTGILSEEAETLSFQLISKIYIIINDYFSVNGSNINPDKIDLLRHGLDAVESIVNGEDYMKYDDLIKKLETINKLPEEEIKPAPPPPPPKELKQEDKNTKRLRYNILELENIFKRLDDIKGEYKNYEGLRFLSSTLNIFKDIIGISKEIHKTKLAQTAEGSYIFIKFLQNYRMDPFDDLSKQIYGYIVYNLKLIYLDKPTKDLDTFISYLNDPVKIFTETKKLIDNE